jgi:hypothetical protein
MSFCWWSVRHCVIGGVAGGQQEGLQYNGVTNSVNSGAVTPERGRKPA